MADPYETELETAIETLEMLAVHLARQIPSTRIKEDAKTTHRKALMAIGILEQAQVAAQKVRTCTVAQLYYEEQQRNNSSPAQQSLGD